MRHDRNLVVYVCTGKGEIPAFLGSLTALMELRLGDNQLTGRIPASLGSLTALVELRLFDNQLTGEIPASLGSLTALRQLRLYNNQLTGEIPASLGSLTALTRLSLSDNHLTGSIPAEIFHLNRLQFLDLWGTNIDHAPDRRLEFHELYLWMDARRRDTGPELVEYSYARVCVDWIVDFWHFSIPVLDDITDVLLLWVTYGRSHQSLWWFCLGALIIADIGRFYAMTYVLVLMVTMTSGSLLNVFTRGCRRMGEACFGYDTELNPERRRHRDASFSNWSLLDEGFHILWEPARVLSGGLFHRWPDTMFFLLDATTWCVLGSRSRSSELMSRFGFACLGPIGGAGRQGLALRGIDDLLWYHPYVWLGGLVFLAPSRLRIPSQRDEASRRALALVKAVGETLVVDSLFLALGVVTTSWEDISLVTVSSSVFSILELFSELQHYIREAEDSLISARRRIQNYGGDSREIPISEVHDNESHQEYSIRPDGSRGSKALQGELESFSFS